MREPYVALHVVDTFTHGQGIQVQVRSRKIGPILFPSEGQTVGDVLAMLGYAARRGCSRWRDEGK